MNENAQSEMEILLPLLAPVVTGDDETILILNPEPFTTLEGINALIVPLLIEVNEPIGTTLAKLPLESLSSAVKILPGL